jgi:hypothetical protein
MAKPKLHRLAEDVFGAGWQSKLARHIDTNPRTVRRWVSGEIPVPEVVILYLQKLKEEKSDG